MESSAYRPLIYRMKMQFPSSSGVLLHPTSLASRHGIGDLGAEARRFVDFLASAGQKLWQVLPLGPTGFGDSPYQCFSALAGNPLLIDLERLSRSVLTVPVFRRDRVDFERGIPWKMAALETAAAEFRKGASVAQRRPFEEFNEENAGWLDDFAL